MIDSLIFLILGTWAFVATMHLIDARMDNTELQKQLQAATAMKLHWQQVAAQAVFEANDLGDEDRKCPLGSLYGDKPNA